MDGLNTWLTIFLNHLNAGLALGVVLAVLILLRPLLLRLLTPQQRVAVWYVAWSIGIFGNLWGLTSLVRVLPVTVWDLLDVYKRQLLKEAAELDTERIDKKAQKAAGIAGGLLLFICLEISPVRYSPGRHSR